MKLLNHSIKYLSVSILVIIGIWGIVFFFNMVEEIKENTDEGLENYKNQILNKIRSSQTLIERNNFNEGFYTIKKIEKPRALAFKETYADTLMFMEENGVTDLNPVRMLTTVFRENNDYFELKIINPMVEKDDLIHRLLINMIWLYAVLIVTIIVVNNMVLQRLWKPFYQFLHQIKSFRFGKNQELPKVVTQTTEFEDLQKAVVTLLHHNAEVFEQQKQFIENAAHELQTPLAIAINKLELLIEHDSLSKKDIEQIAAVMGIIKRLIKLNKSLLLLTKIQNKQFAQEEKVYFNLIIHQAVNEFNEISRFKNIQVKVEEKKDFYVQMNAQLAEILIYNLIRNAFFHNKTDGTLHITIDSNYFQFCNTGTSETLDVDIIYKRFFKTKLKSESTGLGLAIVDAICQIYNLKIDYTFHSKNVHCFAIQQGL